jgi:hypothetical protein
MEYVPNATTAAGLSAAQIAKALGLTPAEQKQVQAAGPGPRKAPKPRQNFSVRSLLLYCSMLSVAARSDGCFAYIAIGHCCAQRAVPVTLSLVWSQGFELSADALESLRGWLLNKVRLATTSSALTARHCLRCFQGWLNCLRSHHEAPLVWVLRPLGHSLHA